MHLMKYKRTPLLAGKILCMDCFKRAFLGYEVKCILSSDVKYCIFRIEYYDG